ncbi:hypothetical protein HPB51_013604 [Rhipicephalus microplus]|uniref:Uncharacterized protein n=1 Tax=Rhipicephalus microplus TaxID=6941 RepID=A0A9J6EH20_RHIMP|nr:hypothetical protein HPB51_013604 [Rhipicephalus microplus]
MSEKSAISLKKVNSGASRDVLKLPAEAIPEEKTWRVELNDMVDFLMDPKNSSSMFPAIPPPTFLQCPGVPLIPWKTWRRVVQVYVNAAAPDATPGAKMALLLNRLGGEGLQAADEQTLPKGVQASGNGATSDA